MRRRVRARDLQRPGRLTVSRVSAAGSATIATIATTVHALRRGLGSLLNARAHMKAVLQKVGVTIGVKLQNSTPPECAGFLAPTEILSLRARFRR